MLPHLRLANKKCILIFLMFKFFFFIFIIYIYLGLENISFKNILDFLEKSIFVLELSIKLNFHFYNFYIFKSMNLVFKILKICKFNSSSNFVVIKIINKC